MRGVDSRLWNSLWCASGQRDEFVYFWKACWINQFVSVTWCFQRFLVILTPNVREDEPNLTQLNPKWVVLASTRLKLVFVSYFQRRLDEPFDFGKSPKLRGNTSMIQWSSMIQVFSKPTLFYTIMNFMCQQQLRFTFIIPNLELKMVFEIRVQQPTKILVRSQNHVTDSITLFFCILSAVPQFQLLHSLKLTVRP